MHASVRAISASVTRMRTSQPDTPGVRVHLGHGVGAPLSHRRHEWSHQPRQVIRQCAGSQQPIALLDRQLNDRLVEFDFGLAQELVDIVGRHERCRRSLPGGPGGPFNVFSQSLSLPLKPASTATS